MAYTLKADQSVRPLSAESNLHLLYMLPKVVFKF